MTMSPHPRWPQSLLAFLAATAIVSLLFAATNNGKQQYPTHLRTSTIENVPATDTSANHRRQLGSLNLALALFKDPKSVITKSDAPTVDDLDYDATARSAVEVTSEHFTPINHGSRNNCQIVYVMGVEGATHRDFIPIIENLARHQIDPITNSPYSVDTDPTALKSGLFGWYFNRKIRKQWGFKVTPEVDDPALVQRVVRESCPENDGKKHVLIEWATFPSGRRDDYRSYRVHRAHEWLAMSPEEVADSEEASNHPTDIEAFYRAYSPYVDIKFVVLHRPFLETIASRRDWDGGPEVHSNIIRGFMLMLRRFLDTHLFDLVTGRRLWSLVCADKITAENYNDEKEVDEARGRVLNHLAEFLGWPSGECEHCFDRWKGSTKDPIEVLGEENVPILREHMKWLESVWPPPGEEGIAEQQCGI